MCGISSRGSTRVSTPARPPPATPWWRRPGGRHKSPLPPSRGRSSLSRRSGPGASAPGRHRWRAVGRLRTAARQLPCRAPGRSGVYESTSQWSDASLVIAVGRHSMAALEELFRRHGGAVLALARRVTRDPHRAEEVESVVHTAALADEVRRAVHRLPAPEREPILLAYFGDRSYRDTAQLLGLPEGTVKSRIRSGLATLRRALDVEGVRP